LNKSGKGPGKFQNHKKKKKKKKKKTRKKKKGVSERSQWEHKVLADRRYLGRGW